MRGRSYSTGTGQWASVRRAIVGALGGCPHQDCVLHAVRELLSLGHGKAALGYQAGEAVAALWRTEIQHGARQREYHRLRCDDADPLGADSLLFDGVQPGKLEIPRDASVRRRGEELSTSAAAGELREALARWRREAEEWSRKPGAGGALVIMVKDGRVVWVGVHVMRGRPVTIRRNEERPEGR